MRKPGFLLGILLSKVALCSVGSSTWRLQGFIPNSVGFLSLFPLYGKFEQSKISTDPQLGSQPGETFSSPIVATEYYQVTHSDSSERAETTVEFRIQQFLLAGMAQPKMTLCIGKYLG